MRQFRVHRATFAWLGLCALLQTALAAAAEPSGRERGSTRQSHSFDVRLVVVQFHRRRVSTRGKAK